MKGHPRKMLVNKHQRRSWLLLMALAFPAIASGCHSEEKEKEPVISVHVTPVSRSAIEQMVETEAIVFPLQQAVIAPKITSAIKRYLVQRGDHVHQGQLLAVLENADLTAAAEQSKGEFEQAQASYATTTGANLPQELQKAELDAASAKAAYAAQQKLYDSRKDLFQQGAIPRRDLDSAEVTLAQARAQAEVAQRQLDDLKRIGEKEALKSASGQMSAARGKYLGATSQLAYSEIRSPIDGVITDRPQFAGELATANQPLLTVMDMSRVIAKAHIAQSDAAFLKGGNKAQIKVSGLSESLDAHVTLVSPALDSGSTTVEVWVESKKPNAALKPGMAVSLLITARTVNDAVVVADSAVFKNSEGADYVVMAGMDNHAEFMPVQTGIRGHGKVQIISGVIVGDPVITSGGYGLPDKAQIHVEADKTEAVGADQEKDKD
jgi:HlyD family secretion protein